MITRSALTASGRALMATPALGGVLRQAGFVRGFADPANKPVDRFAEYLQSGTVLEGLIERVAASHRHMRTVG